MTRKEREDMNELSLQVYGVKSKWQSILKKPQTRTIDQFGSVQGTRVGGYPTVEQVKEAMLIILEKMEEQVD